MVSGFCDGDIVCILDRNAMDLEKEKRCKQENGLGEVRQLKIVSNASALRNTHMMRGKHSQETYSPSHNQTKARDSKESVGQLSRQVLEFVNVLEDAIKCWFNSTTVTMHERNPYKIPPPWFSRTRLLSCFPSLHTL